MSRTADGLRLRVATEADIPAAIELMRVTLGEGKVPRTQEYFAWKHLENPFGRSPMWVAEVGERLVGLRIFMPWRWSWAAAQNSPAMRAVDTATHPEFQGKGIFKRLTLALVEQVARDGAQLIFNTPNDQSRPGYLKMGWSTAGKASLWLRPELRFAGLRRLLRVRAAPALSADEETQERDPARDRTELARALGEAESSGLLASVDSVRAGPRYRTRKDGAYLRWRYVGCPAARYHAATADAREALVVYRVRERRGLRELSISELLFQPSLAGVRAAAEALSLARTAARADYALVAFEQDSLQGLALSTGGFFPIPEAGPIMTTRPLNRVAGAPDPYSVRSFRASIGDLELF